ncbi:MAG: ATP-binding protein, partial [Proteobacteria bacterium]|nr:ATP-binding protein [Pseudomonadota bacterium]
PLWDVQFQMAVPEQKSTITHEKLNAMSAELVGKGQSPWLNRLSERKIVCPDGTRRTVEVLVFVIKTEKGFMSGSITRDITDRKHMEEELLKLEKLESLGILAGGIAHDFNNIVTAIMGNVSLAKMSVAAEDKTFKRLDEAEKACARAKDLTQQLLTFARGGAPIKKTTPISELIKETVNFALRGSNVRCEFALPEDLWHADVDGGQISQVVHNLIINADQAMPGGGLIQVIAENTEIAVQSSLPLPAGRYIVVSVKDQGIGIQKEHLAKIFDPYYTTKQKGSGLGLASCYSIIHNHDGYISVDSEPGAGSTFTFYLSASAGKVEARKAPEEGPVKGKGNILVMDDEEMLRDLAQSVLSTLGYEVALAQDGAEAIELYRKARESGHPFAAVIIDLTVPGGMGGKEAIKELQAIDPQVKAIVSSGYSNDPVMAEFKSHGFSGVIAKPYKIAEMSAVLSEVIGKGETWKVEGGK